MPSSRTAKFYRRCRFTTLDDAKRAAINAAAKLVINGLYHVYSFDDTQGGEK
jgi:cytosine/adenosine deaminase-related metal-dependent hydrolase